MALTNLDCKIIQSLRETQKLSHDPARPVAAIIVDDHGKILSKGTNEPPENVALNIAKSHKAIKESSTWKYYMLEHAERNAIFHALNMGVSLKNCTMYGTLFPCSDCARAIVASGIKRLVVPKAGLHPERDEKWSDHYKYAKEIFKYGNIQVDVYSPDELKSSTLTNNTDG